MIEVEGRRHQPVLGPAPCQVCGAWVEWVACCGWLALASDEMHECGAYVLGAAGRPAGKIGRASCRERVWTVV